MTKEEYIELKRKKGEEYKQQMIEDINHFAKAEKREAAIAIAETRDSEWWFENGLDVLTCGRIGARIRFIKAGEFVG